MENLEGSNQRFVLCGNSENSKTISIKQNIYKYFKSWVNISELNEEEIVILPFDPNNVELLFSLTEIYDSILMKPNDDSSQSQKLDSDSKTSKSQKHELDMNHKNVIILKKNLEDLDILKLSSLIEICDHAEFEEFIDWVNPILTAKILSSGYDDLSKIFKLTPMSENNQKIRNKELEWLRNLTE